MTKKTRTLLKAQNDSEIKTNANQDITADILNNLVENILDSVHFDEDAYTKTQIDLLLSSGNTLNALEDVNLTGLTAGNMLVYNGMEWVNSGFSYENILSTDYYYTFSSGNSIKDSGSFYFDPTGDVSYMEHGLVVGTVEDPKGIDIKGILDVSLDANFDGEFSSNSTTYPFTVQNLTVYLGGNTTYLDVCNEKIKLDADEGYMDVNIETSFLQPVNFTGTINADALSANTYVSATTISTDYIYSKAGDVDITLNSGALIINNTNITSYCQVYSPLEVYSNLYVNDSTGDGVSITTNGALTIDANDGSDSSYIRANNTELILEGQGSEIKLNGGGVSYFYDGDGTNGIEMDGTGIFIFSNSDDIQISANSNIINVNGGSYGIEINSNANGLSINSNNADLSLATSTDGRITFNPYDFSEFINGYVIIDSTINSTQVSDGALIVGGGVGIANDVFIGGKINIAGTSGSVDGDIWVENNHLYFYNSTLNYGSGRIAYDEKPHILLCNNNTGGTTITIGAGNTWISLTGLSLFTYEGGEGITGTSDKVQILNSCHYLITSNLTLAGSNSNNIFFRLFNLTKNERIDGEIGITTTGSGNRQSMAIVAYYRNASINDQICLQVNNNTGANNITLYSCNIFVQATHYEF